MDLFEYQGKLFFAQYGIPISPGEVVVTAEDADAVGLSVLSGAHLTLFPRVVELLRERDLGHVVVFGGGIIPDDDVTALTAAGVARVFTPGTPLQTITDWLEQELDDREAQPALPDINGASTG